VRLKLGREPDHRPHYFKPFLIEPATGAGMEAAATFQNTSATKLEGLPGQRKAWTISNRQVWAAWAFKFMAMIQLNWYFWFEYLKNKTGPLKPDQRNQLRINS